MLHHQRNVQTDKQYYFLKKEQINPPTDIVLKKFITKPKMDGICTEFGTYIFRKRRRNFL